MFIKKIKFLYTYDLFVIGGGAGGLSSSKAAAAFGKKVGLADFTNPGPHSTTWGTGGTCVNVGCIPTKLMPFSARMGEIRQAQIAAGYSGIDADAPHDWGKLIDCVQKHIKDLNKRQDNGVDYHNKLAKFIDNHTLQLSDYYGNTTIVTAENIVICVGSRPILWKDQKLVITSEDVFNQTTAPGKTLVVGASYVGLECAGFIHGFGYPTSIMVRSRLMRQFDNEMASKIEAYMTDSGIRFIKNTEPNDIIDNGKNKTVRWRIGDNQYEEDFDTILYAVGRLASTRSLNLDAIGVQVDVNNHKVITDEYDKTTVDNIYAIGDCCKGRLEYTPIAVMGGRRLAKRLYGGSTDIMDYTDVATTIYTPLEYGCVGLSEEAAIERFTQEGISVYYSEFKPLLWNFGHPVGRHCCGKLIVHKESDRVVGFHYVGPEAAEVTQGFAVAMKMKATKADFDGVVGIHPSLAEEMVQMRVVKR